jgi:hypothetical protein
MGGHAVENGTSSPTGLTNYAAYLLPGTQQSRIGHLDLNTNQITPLSYASGTPLKNLYEVIEVGEEAIVASGQSFPRSDVKLLAPISGRDILAVGKNYAVSCALPVHRALPDKLISCRLMQKNSMRQGKNRWWSHLVAATNSVE